MGEPLMRARGFCSQLRETFSTDIYFFSYTLTTLDCWWSPWICSGFVANGAESVTKCCCEGSRAAIGGFRVFLRENRGQELIACDLSSGHTLTASSQHAVSPEWAHMVTKMERVLITQCKQSRLVMSFQDGKKTWCEVSSMTSTLLWLWKCNTVLYEWTGHLQFKHVD